MRAIEFNQRSCVILRLLSLLCLLSIAGPTFGREVDDPQQGSVKNGEKAERPKWKLYVFHSVHRDKLYYCTLRMPDSLPMEDGAVVLVLFDRQNRKMGEMGLSSLNTHQNERVYPFFLSKELMKNSYLQFLPDPDDDEGEIVKEYLRDQEAVRKEGDMVIREPIE